MKRPETAQETFLYQHQQYKRKIHFLRIFIFVVPRNGLSPALCKC